MPGTEDGSFLRRPKKLIVCCDGTWMNSDSGWKADGFWGEGHMQTPSNVTRISRAIHPEDRDGRPQIVYYQAGVGTGIGVTDQLLGGGTGLGLAEHIREAYAFLANNYARGDNIYLVGFSRGAFTARSLGGLIGQIGLLNKKGLEHFYQIFQDWEHAGDPAYKGSSFFTSLKDDVVRGIELFEAPGNEPSSLVAYLREYRTKLRILGLTHKAPYHNNPNEEIRIQAIACWDTVGALGIPISPFLQRWFNFGPFYREQYLNWMDTALTDNVLNAFHALALDEHRLPFSPAIWEKPSDSDTNGTNLNLKQVWFPGAHSGVGGGYQDTGTADVSLAWMMDQLSGNPGDEHPDLENWIEFKSDYTDYIHRLNSDSCNENPERRQWGNGAIFKSLSFPQSLAGRCDRTPGRYNRLDKKTCKRKEGVPLHEPNEFIHASVRARIDSLGEGPIENPKGWRLWSSFVKIVHKLLGRTGQYFYRPAALQGWVLRDGHPYHDDVAINTTQTLKGTTPWWEWTGKDDRGRDIKNGPNIEKGSVLPEDRLGHFERKLLERSKREVYEEIEASNEGLDCIATLRRMHTMEAETRRVHTFPVARRDG